jgi:hypothetical protein
MQGRKLIALKRSMIMLLSVEDRSISALSYTVELFSLVFEDNFTYRILTESGLAMVDPGPILRQLSELLSLIVLKFHVSSLYAQKLKHI